MSNTKKVIKNVHVKQSNNTYSAIPVSGGGYVTPQMYGAKGDGVTDDLGAFKAAIGSGEKVIIPKASYNLTQHIWTDDSVVLMFKKFCLMLAFALLAINVFARDVKVLISEDKNNISLIASSPFRLKNLDTGKTYKITESGTFAIKKENGQIICGNLKSKKGFILTLIKSNASFEINKNKYNGNLEIVTSAKGINIIEVLDLENYLLGVLPYEMSYSWPIEALKAQAVAARTYTLKSIEV